MKHKSVLALLVLLAGFVTPAQAVVPESLISETAILIDADSGQILFEKDMHKQMRPASTTKIMTGLLALENGDLSDILTMTEEAVSTIGVGAANIALAADEQLTLEQAMHALAVDSAADASNGIAEYVAGTVEDFIGMMNERAKEAGALQTTFQNAHGMPNDEHLTTAYDLAQITRAALATPGFTDIFSSLEYEIPPTNIMPEPRMLTSNNLILVGEYQYEGVLAAKTGWTVSSQYCLVTAAERDGRTLIGVVMKSPERKDKYIDMTHLLDHGFDDFNSVSFPAEELSKEAYALTDSGGNEWIADIIAAGDFSCLIPAAQKKEDVTVSYIAGEDGTYKAVFSLDTETLGEIPVSAVKNVPVPVIAVPSPVSPSPSAEGNAAGTEPTDEDDGAWHPALMWIAGIIVAVIGLCFLLAAVILVLRWLNIRRYRRRHRLKK